ncbi:UDP-glucose/GDP-mannose dehydrogenase family protein [Kibdelosporangium aridum]|uniref:UDP-glucose 6-dehydrogenase n=1 Tax=Kibdelosporangium aridum TaxID=2030 RepID=A0A428ZKI2_KIBAR|nr:UDP-glucose/GDP-mannose dehydrogenase family protein [Kibdelosporangium aridum]RSM88606.1 UDP-glucose/GDP-mannose dehydrogenase family protein [Kibdelosporangium aridum]
MAARRIAVMGAGYVGLTTAACFAHLGHQVTCVDVDAKRVAALSEAEVDQHEPRLAELVEESLRTGRLRFVVGVPANLSDVDFLFLAVPTPTGESGAADLSAVADVLTRTRERLPAGCVVVIKSTVPVGTTMRVTNLLARRDVTVVANPEFLREGHAVEDFLHPQRIVVGSEDEASALRVLSLYAGTDAPTVITGSASAELVKYASNCFLAMKLSYVNTLAELCEQAGADIEDVTAGMRLDERIGAAFLDPGPGWGGSCLPKDTKALLSTSDTLDVDFPLLRAAIDTNTHQVRRVAGKVRDAVGGSLRGVRIGVLGLTFKAGTDDLRDSPALAVAELLAAEGAELTGYDPCVPEGASPGPVRVVDTPQRAARDASAIVVLTEWPEFAALDWTQMAGQVRHPVVVDSRDLLPAEKVQAAGFRLIATGKPDTGT